MGEAKHLPGADGVDRSRVPSASDMPFGLNPDKLFLALYVLGAAAVAAFGRYLSDGVLEETRVTMNVGETIAVLAALHRIADLDPRTFRLPASTVFWFSLSALAWMYPHYRGPFASFTIAILAVMPWTPRSSELRPLLKLLCIISFYEVWAKLFFRLVSHVELLAETVAIGLVGRLVFPQLQATGLVLKQSDNWSIYLLEGCSSFHNISFTVLVWYSILSLGDVPITRKTLVALGTGLVLTVVVNFSRILAMIPSEAAYIYWHDGAGAQIVAFATFAVAALPAIYVVLAARRAVHSTASTGSSHRARLV